MSAQPAAYDPRGSAGPPLGGSMDGMLYRSYDNYVGDNGFFQPPGVQASLLGQAGRQSLRLSGYERNQPSPVPDRGGPPLMMQMPIDMNYG